MLDILTVWIVGDSYIRPGEESAKRTYGNNLGVNAQVEWFGWGGLRWHSVVPCFNNLVRRKCAPDVLLLHCGGNDLGKIRSVDLVAVMKQDLQNLHQRFPNMMIIYSAITQRRCWGSARPRGIDHSRRWVNSDMATFVLEIQGGYGSSP